METLAKMLVDFVKVPIKNWYISLSDRTKFFINDFVVIAVMAVTVWFITTTVVTRRLDAYEVEKTAQHENGTIQRIDAQTSVYNNLQCLMNEIGCKRACVIELHNGVNNPSGLPYLYAEMTYEQTVDGEPFIADEYQKITVSTYKMGQYMHRNYEFFGKTEDLLAIDKKFFNQVKQNGTSHIGVISLHNQNKIEIGFLLVTFNKQNITPDEQKKIIFTMSKYAGYIVSDLTMEK